MNRLRLASATGVFSFLSLFWAFLPVQGLNAQGQDGFGRFQETMQRRLAAQLLRCDAEGRPGGIAQVEAFAFLTLRMPEAAINSLRTQRLPPLEKAMLERALARLQSDQNQELVEMLTTYLKAATSSNALYLTHMDNLRTWEGGGVVTNLIGRMNYPFGGVLGALGNRELVLYISERGLQARCREEQWSQLALELRLVSELRRQGFWTVVVVISEQQAPDGFGAELIFNGTSLKRLTFPFPKASASTVIKESDYSKSQTQLEVVIRDLWLAQLAGESSGGGTQ